MRSFLKTIDEWMTTLVKKIKNVFEIYLFVLSILQYIYIFLCLIKIPCDCILNWLYLMSAKLEH